MRFAFAIRYWLAILSLTVCVAAPCPAQDVETANAKAASKKMAATMLVPWIVVPDLSDPKARDAFENQGQEHCGDDFRLLTNSSPSDRPYGSFLSQSVPAGTRVTCATPVSVTIAGPIPAAPTVGDLSDPAVVSSLQEQSQALCQAPAFVRRLRRISSRAPAGGFDGQDPDPGTVYSCGMQLIAWYSLGPGPHSQALTIPRLSSQYAVDAFANRVRQACGQDLIVSRATKESTEPVNTYLDQSPAQGSAYACGDQVTIFSSSGPPTRIWPYVVAGIAIGLILVLGFVKLVLATGRTIRRHLWPRYAVAGKTAHVRAVPKGAIPVDEKIGLIARAGRLHKQTHGPISGQFRGIR